MANTVSLISYANTFSDWVVATNALVGENNTLAKSNYTKDSGTLYLNDSGLGLQVANGAIVQGQLRVSGVGSSAFIEKNLSVTGQTYFQNTALSFIASGTAEIDGQLTLKGSGTSLEVANNANISGSITIGANSTTNGFSTIQGTLYVGGAANINNTLAVTGTATLKDSLVVVNNTQSQTLEVTDTTTTNYLNVQQNIGSGGSAMVRYNVVTDKLQANTHTNTATAFVSGTTYSPMVVANTSVNTATVTVTGTTATNNLTSNTSTIGTSKVTNQDIYNQANINSMIANSATITVLGGTNSYYDTVRGNTYVSTNILYANNITANAINASSNIVTPTLFVTRKIDANTANGFVNNFQTLGQLTVGGNFVINGSTVYNTNNFTINAGSATGQISKFSVNRGSSGANADIRWDEPSLTYKLNDVENGQYYRILTDEYLSDSTSVTSSSNVASSKVANTLNNYISTANTYFTNVIAAGNTWSQSNVGSALAASKVYTDTSNTFLQTYVSDVVTTKVVPAYTRANTGLNLFTGTSGTAVPAPTGGTTGVTMAGSNGVTIVATSNTLTFSTPQDLRRTASPIFTGLTISGSGSTPLGIGSGGTGGDNRVTALTNLLPDASGVPSGYVLSTQGVGTYTWAAGGTGGGGGGTQPGSRITTNILTGVGNGSKVLFNGIPTFVNGSNQLRVYIDGVRQYDGYTESGTDTVVFTVAPANGAKILFQVDAYMVYAYYANNISISVPIGGIPSTANTIESAISSVEARKADKTGAIFTGHVTGLTVDSAASNTSFATTAFVKNQSYTTQTATDARYPSFTGGNASGTGTGASGLWSISVTGYAGSVGSATESLTIPGKASTPTDATKLIRSSDNGDVYLRAIVSDTARDQSITASQFIVTNSTDNYYRKVSATTAKNAIESAGIKSTTFTTDRTNYKGTTDTSVAGELMWKYYGNGHTIFDASNGKSPARPSDGYQSTVDKSNPDYGWSSNYPTLMGWNGSNTYGVRVDQARYADSAGTASARGGTADSATTSDHLTGPAHTNGSDGWFRSDGNCGWYNENYSGGIYMTDSTWVRTYNDKSFYSGSDILAGGNVTAYSDARLKDNIQTLQGSLSKVLQMRGVEFDKDGEHSIGVIAQEVRKFYPEVVKENNTTEDKILSVNYGALVGPLIESIKELKSQIDSLKAEIEELKGKK